MGDDPPPLKTMNKIIDMIMASFVKHNMGGAINTPYYILYYSYPFITFWSTHA